MISVCLRSDFSGALHKMILVLREWRFGRSRASKVTDIGANRKHICGFLLVRNSNLWSYLAPLQRSDRFYVLLIPPIFHSNCTRSPMFGVSERMGLKLFRSEIIFEEFQPIWSRYLNVTDRRTDGQTDDIVASHGKKQRFSLLPYLCLSSHWAAINRCHARMDSRLLSWIRIHGIMIFYPARYYAERGIATV